MVVWTTCPDCGWNYEQHGDTHMSTRFNCARSRNTVPPHQGVMRYIADYVPYAAPISLEAADAQTERVREIMEQQQLTFGPATDVYTQEHRSSSLVDTSGWDAA